MTTPTVTTPTVTLDTPLAIVVDRAALAKLNSEQLADTMAAVYGGVKAKPVIYVDTLAEFYTLKTLEAALDTNAATLPILLAYHEIELTDADLAAVTRAREVAKLVRDGVAARREALRPDYPFAKSPKDWNGDDALDLGSRIIRRTNGSYYSIGNKAAEALWDFVAPYWSGQVATLGYYRCRAHGDSRYVQVDKARVTIGCQSIERYELEYVAQAKGWTFPKGAAPE